MGAVHTQQYSTRSAKDSGVDDEVVVMMGSAPIATAISMTSKGPAVQLVACECSTAY